MFGSGLIALLLAFGLLSMVTDSADSDLDDDRDVGGDDDRDGDGDGDGDRDPDDTGSAGPGDDILKASEDGPALNGFGGDDLLIGTPQFAAELAGGAGNDTLALFDGDSGFGGAGNDLILADRVEGGEDGLQVLRGGAGEDTLISAGGSILTGGAGADVFIIAPGGLDADGNPQAMSGDPISVPQVTDFNLAEDRLVIDLGVNALGAFDQIAQAEFDLTETRIAPALGDDVTLSAARTADGSGIALFTNGVQMVVLNGFQDMAPDDVLSMLDVVVVEGPGGPDGAVPGLTFKDLGNGNLSLVLTDDFVGGGNYGGGDEYSRLDLRGVSSDLRVTVSESGVITVEPVDGSWPAATFEEIDQILLGDGNDIFDGSASNGSIAVVAGNGTDTLIGSDNTAFGDRMSGAGFISYGDIEAAWDSIGPTSIVGGDGGDILEGGLGDSLTGGAGADQFFVLGVGETGAGPAIIDDFNPVEDALTYTWVNTEDNDIAHDVSVQDSDDGLVIIDNGRIVAVLPGISLADDPLVTIEETGMVLPI